MAILYLDTSALVKLYVQEEGTAAMLELAHPDAGLRLAVLAVTRAEFRAAVRRRAKLGDIASNVADELIHSFGNHLATLFQIQPITEMVLDEAAGLIDRHLLRAYDAIQLGGYMALRSAVGNEVETAFVCADTDLFEAAQAEGFTSINPLVM